MKLGNSIAAIITILIGGAAIYLSKDFPDKVSNSPGPGFYPTILGYLLIFLGVILLINSIREANQQEVHFFKAHQRKVLMLFVFAVLAVVLINFLGFLIAMTIFLIVGLIYLGMKRKLFAVGLSIILAFAIFYLFDVVFNIPLPTLQLF